MISGTNFRPGAAVQFGSVPAAAVQLLNSSQIQAITPAEPSGRVAVKIEDSSGQVTTTANAFSFTTPSLQIATNALPAASVSVSYSENLGATGGSPPYTWSTSNGGLPVGLQLNPSSGGISGTPTQSGSYIFGVQVRDANNASTSAGLLLKISAAPTVAVALGPVISIASPSADSTISGISKVSASVSDSQNSISSVQLYLNGSPLGSVLTSGPYTFAWDTTQIVDGNYDLTAKATDAAGKTATSSAIAVTVKNLYWNPSVLGVPWASDFNHIAANEINIKTDSRLSVKAAGDGNTDDTAALRGAIQLASASGGGVVYFPTGDYKIVTPSNSAQGSPIVVPSFVVLRGSGPTTSRIFVNDPNAASETDGTWTWGGVDFQGASLSGMTDLGIYAINSSSSPCAVLWNRGPKNVGELFFNNLDVYLGNGRAFWFQSTNNLLVQNSHFDSKSLQSDGPIYVVANTNVSFLNNTITYHFGRVHMQNNTNLLIQGNTIIRDAQNMDMDNGTAVESGGVELSFGQNIQALNNTIQTLNAPANEISDGEAILTQNSNTPDILDAGTATAITSTTLTDANALWGSVTTDRLPQYPQVVAILTGSATGQWREIQAINTSTKTLTLNQPWNPVPELGSLYSIFAWTFMNSTIQGNILIDNPLGIVLYDGCYTCTIQNNVLTNSSGINLRVVDEALDHSLYPEGRRVHQVAMNSKILNNTVSNTSGVHPAFIALDAEAFATDSYNGMGLFNIQVGGNTISPYAGNPSQVYKQNEISQEGYFPCFLFGPARVKAPVTTVFQSIRFWNNSQNAIVTFAPSFTQLASQACVVPSAP
jgi:parallel beta-helix repeat protein